MISSQYDTRSKYARKALDLNNFTCPCADRNGPQPHLVEAGPNMTILRKRGLCCCDATQTYSNWQAIEKYDYCCIDTVTFDTEKQTFLI